MNAATHAATNVGSFQQIMDSKNRIILPGAFRQAFSKSFIISAGFDRCLYLWRPEDWDAFKRQELGKISHLKKQSRDLERWFHAHAHIIELDSQNRFVVPPPLRASAALSREIILAGVANRVEVWNRDEWQKYMDKISGSIEEIAESLSREQNTL